MQHLEVSGAVRHIYMTLGSKRLIDKYGLSEHKQCDNAATNANSENGRSRMEASSVGKRGYGGKGRWVKYWACSDC
jgi:hypothetical protein